MKLARRVAFATGAAALAGTFATPVNAAQFEFKAGSTLSADNPSSVRMTQMWAAIERDSGGQMRTQFFPNSLLGGESAMIEQLRLGALQFLMMDGTLPTLVPASNIAFLGFAFSGIDEGMRVMDGPLGKFIADEIAAKGLHSLRTVWSQGVNQVGSNTRPIRVPDDLHGFKIRIPQARIVFELFKELGASPVSLSIGELYTGLQTKLIDGEALPSIAIETFRTYEVNKYVSLTNQSVSVLWMLANLEVWNRLPPDLQNIVERNNTKYALLERRDMKIVNASIENKLARQGIAFNGVDQGPFRARLGSYYANWASNFGPTAWGLLQQSLGRKVG